MPRKKKDELEPIEDGDNAKYLSTALLVMEKGRTRCDLTNYDETLERIRWYFDLMVERDQKPTITGLAQALGTNHKLLWEVRNNLPSGLGARKNMYGHKESFAPPEVRELINQAYNIMHNLWEDYMMNGKINPASGIFLGKNFYGMKDEVEHTVAVKENPLDAFSAEDIASRYLGDKSSFEGDT